MKNNKKKNKTEAIGLKPAVSCWDDVAIPFHYRCYDNCNVDNPDNPTDQETICIKECEKNARCKYNQCCEANPEDCTPLDEWWKDCGFISNVGGKKRPMGVGNCGCRSSSKSHRLQHKDYMDNLYRRVFADETDPVPVTPCDCGKLTKTQKTKKDALIKKCEDKGGTAEWVEPTSGWCEDDCTGDCFGEVICTTPSSPSGTARTIRTPCSQSKGVLPTDASSHSGPVGTLNHCCVCDSKSKQYACQTLAPIVNRGDTARRKKECRETGAKYGLPSHHVIGSDCGEDGHGNCKHNCWPAPPVSL